MTYPAMPWPAERYFLRRAPRHRVLDPGHEHRRQPRWHVGSAKGGILQGTPTATVLDPKTIKITDILQDRRDNDTKTVGKE